MTVAMQHLVALAHLLWRPESVPRIGVARDDLEHPWTEPGQDKRWPRLLNGMGPRLRAAQLVVLAVERADVLAQHQVDHLDRLFETRHQLPGLGKRNPKHGVLWRVPTGTKTDLEAPVGDVVHSGGFLGKHRRVPEGVRGHEHADAYAFGACRKSREQRPGLEVRLIGMGHIDQVVAQPRAFEAKP